VVLGGDPAAGFNVGIGIAVTGVFGIVVTGVTGFGVPKLAAPVPVVVPPTFDFGAPNRLAALIYCANAAFCSGVAVLFATACNMALNSGLAAAISVRALTVILFACAAEVCAAGTGVGAGAGGGTCLTGFSGLGGFSAFSSTFRTDRKRVSGKICGPMTTGQIPRRVVMYWDAGAASFLPRRVGFQTLGK